MSGPDELLADVCRELGRTGSISDRVVLYDLLTRCRNELLRRESAANAALAARCETAEADIAYMRHRLKTIIPLFEEARDALPAISLASAKLHNVDLSLGDRMDAAGTYTREQWDAALASQAAGK